MKTFHQIPINIEGIDYQDDSSLVNAVIYEIMQQMETLIINHKSGAVDLKSLPFSSKSYQLLQQRLGKGEVAASVNLSGETIVYETQYSGVWWVIHKNIDESVIAEHIEVTKVPSVLCAHIEDIKVARNKLAEEVNVTASA